jgi:hypothetical protein
MAPSFSPSFEKLSVLLRRMDNGRLVVPEYQRGYVWVLRKKRKLVNTILSGYPIPNILLRSLEDENETTTLEDGQQRLVTMKKFTENEFELENGNRFSDLSAVEQDKIRNYVVLCSTYVGATDDEARQMFNDHQDGMALTVGERLCAARSPIVDYTARMLLTPGEGFHDRMVPIVGARNWKTARGADMTQAYALCAGFAHGIDYLSRKWDDVDDVLHVGFNEAAVTAKLDLYVRVLERVHELAPITTKTRRNQIWNLGNFGGYIAFSIEVRGEGRDGMPTGTNEFIEMWAQHIGDVYRRPEMLGMILHRDLSSARSWKTARWSNGLNRLLEEQARAAGVAAAVAQVIVEESDGEESED